VVQVLPVVAIVVVESPLTLKLVGEVAVHAIEQKPASCLSSNTDTV
jgi:hypothetical protein